MIKIYFDTIFENYANFHGRASRAEYWSYFLINLIITVILGFLGKFFLFLALFTSVYTLLTLTPGLAVGARRLHDIDRSAWWLLIGLVPIIGSAILIFFLATKSSSSH